MNLACLTEEAYLDLYSNRKKNEDFYLREDYWLPEYFEGAIFCTPSSVTVGDFSLVTPSWELRQEEKSSQDFANTKILYDAMKNLTPQQASNRYLWAYLCHQPQFSSYIQKRWLGSGRKNTIGVRYFGQSLRDIVSKNALSRLWWAARVTYDEGSDNPYYLTEILLKNQTIFQDFMDTNSRMSLTAAKGTLEAIDAFSKELSEGEGITEYYRAGKKYMNRLVVMMPMEFMSSDEIKNTIYEYMMKYRKESRSMDSASSAA